MKRLLLFAISGRRRGCYSEEPAVGVSYGYGYGYAAPQMEYVGPGVQVISDYDYPVFYSDGFYWRWDGGVWYRSGFYNRGWGVAYDVPIGIRGIARPEAYAHYHGGLRRLSRRPEAIAAVTGLGGYRGRRGSRRYRGRGRGPAPAYRAAPSRGIVFFRSSSLARARRRRPPSRRSTGAVAAPVVAARAVSRSRSRARRAAEHADRARASSRCCGRASTRCTPIGSTKLDALSSRRRRAVRRRGARAARGDDVGAVRRRDLQRARAFHDGHLVVQTAVDRGAEARLHRYSLGLSTVRAGTHLLIAHVEPSSSVAAAGVSPGDEVLAIDGRPSPTCSPTPAGRARCRGPNRR